MLAGYGRLWKDYCSAIKQHVRLLPVPHYQQHDDEHFGADLMHTHNTRQLKMYPYMYKVVFLQEHDYLMIIILLGIDLQH